MRSATLTWECFDKLTDARARFPKTPCVYVQTDKMGNVIRIGKTEKGLEVRYRGGTGYAIDAAMHKSGNRVYVAKVQPHRLTNTVERELIWSQKEFIAEYNTQGLQTPPKDRLKVIHKGKKPKFRGTT